MEELKKYFTETPIMEGNFLKVNNTLSASKHTYIYISKDDIKGFKVTEIGGEEFDVAYTIEVIFDYKAFGYDNESAFPEPSNIIEFKSISEAEKAIEFLLKELNK